METDIAAYLSKRLPEAKGLEVVRLHRIPGGASRETWSVDASWLNSGGIRQEQGFIFRRDPEGSLLDSDRRLEFEFYRSFSGTNVPVPKPLWLEMDASHLDRPFFVMERIDGCESRFETFSSPDFAPYRVPLGRRMYEILAHIVNTPIADLPATEVCDVPEPAQCWRRELEHWEGVIDANEMDPQPIVRAGIRWLRRHPPPPAQRVTVVHGDYRSGNFLYQKGEIFGILDWEMAHFGDPLEDLAWSFLKTWQWAKDGTVGALLDRDEAIRIWEAKTGLRANAAGLHWWDVFSCIKAQGIWLTGAHEFTHGRATDLLMAFTSYWLINSQDKYLLEVLGRTS